MSVSFPRTLVRCLCRCVRVREKQRMGAVILALCLLYLFVHNITKHYGTRVYVNQDSLLTKYPDLRRDSLLSNHPDLNRDILLSKHPDGDSLLNKYTGDGGSLLSKHPDGGSLLSKYPGDGGSLLSKHPDGGSLLSKYPGDGSLLTHTGKHVASVGTVSTLTPIVTDKTFVVVDCHILRRVLIVYDTPSNSTAKSLKEIFQSLKIPIDVYRQRPNKSLPLYSVSNGNEGNKERNRGSIKYPVGKYSLLLFADYQSMFGRWSPSERQHYFNYSVSCNVTIILFSQSSEAVPPRNRWCSSQYSNISSTPIPPSSIKQVLISSTRNLYYSKNPLTLPNPLLHKHYPWSIFRPITSSYFSHSLNHTLQNALCNTSHVTNEECHMTYNANQYGDYSTFQNTSQFELLAQTTFISNSSPPSINTWPTILVDKGLNNVGFKVHFGAPISHWSSKVLFMDVVRLFSANLFRFGRRRWILIDIDDIFVAPVGKKMTKDDVQALLQAQEEFRMYVPGLTFNLGFCGMFYNLGTKAEVLGSQELVRHADSFWWFNHVYNHYQPHTLREPLLEKYLQMNEEFASNHSLPLRDNSYSVSPHHSGVYPVYPPLYDAWRHVCNVTMTTTEEYPHLNPEQQRHGFIHKGIMVLPRQTCKLFTHTISYDTFPGGQEALVTAAHGGSVFNTLLLNPISIFMTHVTNYATDRLALVMFRELLNFTATWTNLELVTERPLDLGVRYFKLFPEYKLPVWQSPCSYKRHRELYPPTWNCTRLPSLIILGPQKTGTTALHSFLNLHPNITSNIATRDHYEEIQFFNNDTLYEYGVEWYMEQFQYPKSDNEILFEKSATYFTHSLAPPRIKALLPSVKLIVILQDPVKRAYSWYQHMRSHQDPTALKYTFSHVIGQTDTNVTLKDGRLMSLRQRCLSPGQYHVHITKWLEHFHSRQLLMVDGEKLVSEPLAVLRDIQEFVNVEFINYSKLLRYNNQKGFYCTLKHCLGPNKGRKYPPLTPWDRKYLETRYRGDNALLLALLKKLSMKVPKWLVTKV